MDAGSGNDAARPHHPHDGGQREDDEGEKMSRNLRSAYERLERIMMDMDAVNDPTAEDLRDAMDPKLFR